MAPQTFLFPLASFAVYSGAAIIFLIVKEFGLIFFFFFYINSSVLSEQGGKEFQKKRGHFIVGSGIIQHGLWLQILVVIYLGG